MDFFTKEAMPSPPYAPILPPHLFTRENVMRLKALGPDLISVLVLINDFSKVSSFSHESQCPNQYSSYNRDGQCNANWNPPGSGLLLEDFPFPIYFVNDHDEIEKMANCSQKFNSFDLPGQRSRSLCSIEVDSVMSGAVNSEVCMRRSEVNKYLKPITYCDPLQGRNVYATLFPRPVVSEEDQRAADPTERFIMVTARLDTTSMFDGIGVGAMGSLVSFATLVSTAHILSKLLPPGRRPAKSPNVLFALFNGETYDYIGSQRMVYDMERGDFPFKRQQTRQIRLSNIDLLVDIGTLDSISNPDLYSLKDAQHKEHLYLRDLITKYNINNNLSNDFNITPSAFHTNRIPPTSANTFLRANRSLPVVILNAKPTNQFLHSIYDTHLNINFQYKNRSDENFLKLSPLNGWQRDFNASDIQMGIRNLSTVLAYSLYEVVTGETWVEPTEGGNPYLIDEFLYCWLFSAKCRLLYSAVSDNYTLFSHYPPRYISIDRSHSIQSTIWAYDLMGLLVGEQQALEKEACKPLPYRWYPGYDGQGVCIRTTQNYSVALSPAFRVADYDWKSGEYSTWTESTWSSMSARIFLRPSPGHQAFTLSVGLIVLLLSFFIVYVVNAKTDVLFGNCASSEA